MEDRTSDFPPNPRENQNSDSQNLSRRGATHGWELSSKRLDYSKHGKGAICHALVTKESFSCRSRQEAFGGRQGSLTRSFLNLVANETNRNAIHYVLAHRESGGQVVNLP
jgi:hypothetical protein